MEHILSQVRSLRRFLHVYPELSGKEFHTHEVILGTMNTYKPDEIIERGRGTGLAFIFKGKKQGKTLLFRADMDAVPVQEQNNLAYGSRNAGASHACGHDGHCAIMAGFAAMLHESPPARGTFVLLFQPAEETGKGAEAVLNEPAIKKLKPDYVFALHNLPGFEKGSIITRKGIFAAASKGLIIKLSGKAAHAAYPETGFSPSIAMADLIKELSQLQTLDIFANLVVLTIVHARLGEPAFGVSPSEATVMATLRSIEDEDMIILSGKVSETINNICSGAGLKADISWTDEFIATINDYEAVSIIEDTAAEIGYNVISTDFPFRWSEDFGQFTARYKGALFGLGAGTDCNPLHSDCYDFPDEIIETGIKMFYGICEQFAKEK